MRPEVGDVTRRDLLPLDPHQLQEVGFTAELVHPVGVAGRLQISDRTKSRRESGLRLEHLVEIERVLGHPRQRLGRHASRHDQAGRVPRRARGQLVAFEQHDVGPPEFREVVGHAGTDHTATDDHHPCGLGDRGCRVVAHDHRITDARRVRPAGSSFLPSRRRVRAVLRTVARTSRRTSWIAAHRAAPTARW